MRKGIEERRREEPTLVHALIVVANRTTKSKPIYRTFLSKRGAIQRKLTPLMVAADDKVASCRRRDTRRAFTTSASIFVFIFVPLIFIEKNKK